MNRSTGWPNKIHDSNFQIKSVPEARFHLFTGVLVVMVVDIVLDMEVDKVAIIVVDIVVGKVVSDIVVKIPKED